MRAYIEPKAEVTYRNIVLIFAAYFWEVGWEVILLKEGISPIRVPLTLHIMSSA